MKDKEPPKSTHETDESSLRKAHDLVVREWERANNETGEPGLRTAAPEDNKATQPPNPIPPPDPKVPPGISSSAFVNAETPWAEPFVSPPFGSPAPDSVSGSANTQYHPQDSTEVAHPRVVSPEGATLSLHALSSTTPEEITSFPTVNPAAYQMKKEVGRGGLGRVSLAFDKRLQREVAIKELLRVRREAQLRFEREARLTAKLQHPGIVPIYEAGVWPSGEPFYAMKIVEGETLDQLIRKKNSLEARLSLLPEFLSAVEAIAYAHSRHVVHRDLKPQNILVGAFGETVVIDWGLAKEIGSEEEDEPESGPSTSPPALTQTGAIIGTPAYMPPEQAKAQAVDKRADVYSLGVILYEILSGQRPYQGNSAHEILRKLTTEPPVPLEARQTGIPSDLLAIVQKAMARNANERYPSAKELAEDLKKFQTGQLIGARGYSRRELLVRWAKRHKVVVSAAVLVAALTVVAFVLVLREQQRTKDAFDAEKRQRNIAETNQREAEAAKQTIKEEKDKSDRGLVKLLTEQGRQELLAGNSLKAAVYLSEAYQKAEKLGTVTRTLRLLLADAMRDVDALEFSLNEHENWVSSAKFSPDGDRIVTASNDGTVKVWDANSGKRLLTLEGHQGPVSWAEFSADGNRILTVDQMAKIWDATTGELLFSLEEPQNQGRRKTLSAKLSPDKTRIVTFGAPTTKVWEVATGKLLSALARETSVAEFSPDGSHLVLVRVEQAPERKEPNAVAEVWDIKKNKRLGVFSSDMGPIWFARFHPSGNQIVTTNDAHQTQLWDVTGKLLFTLEAHKDFVWSAAFNADGSQILTASNDQTAKLWDTQTGKLLLSLEGHTSGVGSAEFSPDGRYIVTASGDNTAKVWSASSGQLLLTLAGHFDSVVFAEFSPDRKRVVTASKDGAVKIWSVVKERPSLPLESHAGVLGSPRFSPDRSRLVALPPKGNTIQCWEASTGKLLFTQEGHQKKIRTVRFSPDGSRLVTASTDQTAKVWDAVTGQLLLSLEGHSDWARSAEFSPDGRRIVTSSYDKTARVWDAHSGELLLTLVGSESLLESATFSPDGSHILTTGIHSSIQVGPDDTVLGYMIPTPYRTTLVWDAKTGQLLFSLEGHSFAINTASFSQDGTRILTASDDTTAKIWDATNGKLLFSLESHVGMVSYAAFHLDGSRIVTVSDDKTAKIWDATNGKLLFTLEGNSGDATFAEFSFDGSYLVTVGYNQSAKLWDVTTGKLLSSLGGVARFARFSPDGNHVLVGGDDQIPTLWLLEEEHRRSEEIAALVKQRAPWEIFDTELRWLETPDYATSREIQATKNLRIVSKQKANILFNQKNWPEARKAYETYLKQSPNDAKAWNEYSMVLLLERKDPDKAIEVLTKAASFPENRSVALYNLACTWALQGNSDKAISALKESLAAGYRDFEGLKADPDLESLRTDPRFEALLVTYAPTLKEPATKP